MDRSRALRLCAIGLIIFGASRHHAVACDTSILGISDSVAHQMIANGEIHVADPSHNVGVYAWSDVLNQHVLVASYLDMDLLFTPPEAQPGDVVEPFDAPGGQAVLNSCDPPPTIPPVIVTTSLPSRTFIGRVFISIRTFFGAGGAGRVTSTTGTTVPNNPANDEYATCTADAESRFHHAHRDAAPYINARFNARRPVRRGELLRVTYDDGGTEVWRAVGPLVSATAPSVQEPPVRGTLRCP